MSKKNSQNLVVEVNYRYIFILGQTRYTSLRDRIDIVNRSYLDPPN